MNKFICICIIFVSCARSISTDNIVIIPQDSVGQFIKSYIDKAKTIDFLLKKLAKTDSSLNKEEATVDFLVIDVKKYQGNEMDKIKLENQLTDLSNFITHYSDSIALLKKENIKVNSELNNVNSLYRKSKNESNKAKQENDSLKKEFSIPKISAVSIKCYGFKLRRIRGPLEFETLVSKEVKRITIQFNIPFNNLINKDSYTFTIKIVGIINKTKSIKMTGKEIIGQSESFELVGLLKSGEYPVQILVDNEKQYESILTLK